MKHVVTRAIACVASLTLAVGLFGCSTPAPSGDSASTQTPAKTSPLSKDNPTTITVWNYYNGDQQAAFEDLVAEFNTTVGAEQGIAVNAVSQGTVDNLATALLESAEGKVGAQDMPTLASIYAETAYILDEEELLVNLDDYFTEDELAAYIPNFIEEGRLTTGGSLKVFPVSKSTECFAVNTTDWAGFQQATGITPESVTSFEKLTAAAEAYYEYTDGLTPDVPEDGKALYGRDSISNYMVVGAKQLGHETFVVSDNGVTVDLDRATMKTLWDNYYIPYINGYFTAEANHRSEDVKTGTVLAMTGSTSGVSFLPTSVTDANDQTHDIELSISKPLCFDAGTEVAVQQGAGYCVLKGTEEQQYAAVEFLKWFTESERNLQFSVESGYSPVTSTANDADAIRTAFAENNAKPAMLEALLVSGDVYLNEETYTSKPFNGSKDTRDILNKALSTTATTDREAVKAAIAAGSTRADAVAQYSTDEYFDTWYNNLKQSIEGAVKE